MEKYKFDVVSRTLTITAKFAAKMNNPESEEYALVTKFQADFPGLTIAKKTHKSATRYTTKSGEKFNCNQYKNLTYDRMEKFIGALPNNDGYKREYNFVKDSASSIQHNAYALVRTWFVAQFPEFRNNPLFYLYNTPTLVSGSEILRFEAERSQQDAA